MSIDITSEITFRKLSIFMTFMDKGNIARTAEALGLSGVSVHRALHTLEENVRCPLFTHKGRNLIALPSAWTLLEYCQEVMQVMDRGLDEARFAALEQWVHPHLQPDLTLIFDLDPAVAARRLAGTGNAPDRFEREKTDFFERVRAAYLRRAAVDPGRVRVIDASQTPDEIKNQLEQIISKVCFK